ncbi:HIT family protein [Paludibacterium yongneupense]|uniref:HIT family protein n=1 Tax=Paludibacterium yongneupense TaxID=400061 RepID=UPI00042267E6|nr:HIT family protein [Paludibacterium yongneupense]
MTCELCTLPHGIVLHQDEKLIVLAVDEAGYPGFCRVIWKAHVAELSDLASADRNYLLAWVVKVERAIRRVMQPDKINLASLGNMVPHLHWHVIPRFRDDSHFPSPIWAAPRREPAPHEPPDLVSRLRAALADEADND